MRSAGSVSVLPNPEVSRVRTPVSAMWPARGLLDLLGIDLPTVQAPMAGANGAAMAIAVTEADGLGSLP